MYRYILFVLAIAAGCSTAPGPVHMTEVECRLNSDCDVGSYCDPFLNLCGWDCTSDDECEPGMYCAVDSGRCLREETPPVVEPGHAVMVANFEPVEALLTAAEAVWQPVGILDVAAYGADLPLESVTFNGPGEAFDGLAIAEADMIIGRVVEPIGFIDDVDAVLDTPRLVRDGEHVRLPVWVRIDEAGRDLTQLMRTAAIYPHAVSTTAPEGVTVETVVPRAWSYLMLAASAPMMIRQPLATTTLANGIEQDLYRVLVASRSTSQPVTVGSLTVLLDGVPEGRALTQFRVRVGSSLYTGGYRVIDADSGADVTTAAGFVPEPSLMSGRVTIVFDGGLRILPGSGQVITLSATPSGFLPGDTLNVTQNFCDFSCPTYQRYYTDYNEADGSLDLFTGMNHERFLDPIVWTDGNAYGLYAGSRYLDYSLLGNSTLSM